VASRFARWRAAIRDTTLGLRLASALWAVCAFCVWNVVFDRVLVLAGRRYSYAAAVAARQSAAYIPINDWMRPAVTRGAWLASAAAAAVLAVGLAGVFVASRRQATASRNTATALPESLRRS
jgi:hypothetical protein